VIQHSPGPWAIEYDEVDEDWRIVSEPRTGYVAVISYYEHDEDDTPKDLATVEEVKANASLIAAAPELLEALEMALDELMNAGFSAEVYGRSPVSDALILGAKVIAKAKGEK
jgi:hypothetical protein